MKRLTPFLIFGLLALLFTLGAAQLYSLRLRKGDLYPPLSSLRADPLGAKVLYDALATLQPPALSRNYNPLSEQSPDSPPATLFFLGATTFSRLDEALEFARLGNRVVITFQPERHVPERPKPQPEKKPDQKPDAKEKRAEERAKAVAKARTTTVRGLEEIGVRLKREPKWSGRNHAVPLQPGLEPSLNWGGVVYFEADEKRREKLKTLYEYEGKPVMVELRAGAGSVVLAADSYFLSNEALYTGRSPRLISHLLGNSPRVIFDEYHHHVMEKRGIAWLIREYRLTGVIAALTCLALLFLWKEAVPLLPRREASPAEESSDVGNGFVLLLRRSIPRSRILAVCIEEWNKTFASRNAPLPAPAKGSDPATEYNRISNTLPKKMR